MALEDQNLDWLRERAGEHGIEGRSSMNKEQLVAALRDANVPEPEGDTQVHGFQEAPYIPPIPTTPDDFAKLLRNPNLPAENQSAPRPEDLNPHLF